MKFRCTGEGARIHTHTLASAIAEKYEKCERDISEEESSLAASKSVREKF